MPDCVFDTSFIRLANDSLFGEKEGNLLNRRLTPLRQAVAGQSHLRYNRKLLDEYSNHIKEGRNDIIEQFFVLLDSPQTTLVRKHALSRQDNAKANRCRWPTHDRHVLAAAIGGIDVVIHVTENALGACSKKVKLIFGFHVNHVA
jgi:hypothetical protein